MVMSKIETIDGLIDVLGGDTKVAELLDISQPAVANWKVRGQIAAGWHLRLLAEAQRRGVSVAPKVFGLTDAEAVGLFHGGVGETAAAQ